MKITSIETVRFENIPNVIYVLVHADSGLVGLGETYFGARAVEEWVHETAAQALLGEDPLAIERHWQTLNPFIGFQGTGVEARGRSALDLALWDLFGKVVGLPLYQLLGGKVRERIAVYNTCAGYQYVRGHNSGNLPVGNWGVTEPSGDMPYEDLHGFLHRPAELANSLAEEGFTGMKIWPFDLYADDGGHYISTADLKKGLEPFRAIREAVGDQMRIMVEMHSKWDLPTAKLIAEALEEYQPYWFEDPVRADNIDALAEFRASTRVFTTGSETLATRWSFREALEKKAVDIVMFDPSWVGGVSEGKKIAALAEAHSRPIAPHDCQGPVEFSAAVHLSISSPNAIIQEVVRAFFSGWYRELVTEVPKVENGYVYPLEGPGLGTELRPDALERNDVVRRATNAP